MNRKKQTTEWKLKVPATSTPNFQMPPFMKDPVCFCSFHFYATQILTTICTSSFVSFYARRVSDTKLVRQPAGSQINFWVAVWEVSWVSLSIWVSTNKNQRLKNIIEIPTSLKNRKKLEVQMCSLLLGRDWLGPSQIHYSKSWTNTQIINYKKLI